MAPQVTMYKLVLFAAVAANVISIISSEGCRKCKKNEEYNECINGDCVARNCSQLGESIPCGIKDSKECTQGCVCQDGYLRANNGTCIKTENCPSCGGDPNATAGCGTFCKKCSNYGKRNIACPDICRINGCECRDGFIYDENIKKCVRPKQCTPTCKQHEVYSDCVNGGCDARNCSQLGFPVPCVKMDPSGCIKGCVCEPGYLRAGNGTCVPVKECPSCGGDDNATSRCGVFCKQCKGNVPCPKICKVNGCDCKPGFVYDPNIKKCVKLDECTPTCQKNEVYSSCTNSGCEAKDCTQLGKPVPCIRIDPKFCKKGCVCDEGYLRADNGTCIPKDKCPSCGGDPNATSGCGVFCNRCSGPIPCPRICEPNGCDCKDGYVYDDNTKKCTLPENCTPKCKDNEVYSDCANGGCTAKDCSQLGNSVPCDKRLCRKGCVCDEGYLRADNGTCIPKDECPSCGGDPNARPGCGVFCNRCRGTIPCPRICKPNGCDCKDGYVYDDNTKKCTLPENCTPTCKDNEIYSECTNGGCTAKNCSQVGKPVPCIKIDPKFCKKGCICDEGYLRADNGTCIPKDKCPPSCPENQVYSPCMDSDCKPTNCSQLGDPIDCSGPKPCKKGCTCKDGYVRDNNGICIPIDNCPSCGGDPNATIGCGTFCKRCSNYKTGPVACPAVCQLNGCECREGYVYDETAKKCVLPRDCPPKCKKNEEYSDCMNSGCNAKNCSQLGNPISCNGPEPCMKGCTCKKDYIRADNGTCIPILECPSCGGDPNAVTGCGVFCTRCSNYNSSGPIPCRASCQLNGCECRKGYVYDEVIKKCVLSKDCTPICKENEVVTSCINGRCGHTKCSDLGGPILCIDPPPGGCIKGCLCAKGYLRAENGTCIPEEQCPCGGDPNAKPGCGAYCTRCSNYKGGLVACANVPCKFGGCDCRDGFIYDEVNKKCVLPKDCPAPKCPPNEVHSDCANSYCDARNCSEVGKPVPCVDMAPGQCVKGCVCETSYVRNDKGICIPKTSCPSCNDDPNATSSPCGGFCTRCDNYKMDPVPPCPPVCFPNTCECKSGFIYDQNIGKCVLPEQCSPTCKKNEVFSNCTNGGCLPQNCTQLGKPVPCVKLNPDACKKGCVCAPGYLRDANGICVPSSECPSCNDDPNAEQGCGSFCKRCSNYGQQDYKCPIGCILNGCQCRKGFIYDQNIKKCVRPEQCTPTCKKNEVFSNCTNGGCEPQNCTQLGKPVPCVKLDPDACKKGCVCAIGYLRAENGTCIPTEECPSCNDDPNAEKGCGSFCARCSNNGQSDRCTFGCIYNGCECRKGFIYDQNIKKCVRPERCTPTCKKNEVFSNCTNGGCEPQNCTQLGKPVPCVKLDPDACKKGCVCAIGYLRAENGTCIPTLECPSCNDDPNAEKGCGSFCARCSNNGQTDRCTFGCIYNGCECRKGFIYDQNIKKCVRPEQCTPTCKENEVYSECTNGGCSARNCSQVGKPVPCVKLDAKACIKGCVCDEGYLRADNGTCVPTSECPLSCKKNEEYSTCANGICRFQNCSQYGDPLMFCPKFDTSKCKPGCICKIKYLKNNKGECIPQEECPEARCKTTTTEKPKCEKHELHEN